MSNPLRTIHVNVKTAEVIDQCTRIEAYLYSNFEMHPLVSGDGADPEYSTVVINGHDNAGWTAEAQADRLWSGMFGATVVR